MREPVQIECEHMFCTVSLFVLSQIKKQKKIKLNQHCITEWRESRNTCPKCQHSVDPTNDRRPQMYFMNLHAKLRMHCQNKDNGCRADVILENYQTHMANCTFGLKSCEIPGCDRKYKSSDEIIHQLEHANDKNVKVSGKFLHLFISPSIHSNHFDVFF